MVPACFALGRKRLRVHFCSSRKSSTCRGRHLGGGLADTLAVKRGEIDRIDVKRRKAARAHGVGDNLARERKQKARALNHDDRMHVVWGNIAQPEQTRIVELELE